jgi:hypothetical protein
VSLICSGVFFIIVVVVGEEKGPGHDG